MINELSSEVEDSEGEEFDNFDEKTSPHSFSLSPSRPHPSKRHSDVLSSRKRGVPRAVSSVERREMPNSAKPLSSLINPSDVDSVLGRVRKRSLRRSATTTSRNTRAGTARKTGDEIQAYLKIPGGKVAPLPLNKAIPIGRGERWAFQDERCSKHQADLLARSDGVWILAVIYI